MEPHSGTLSYNPLVNRLGAAEFFLGIAEAMICRKRPIIYHLDSWHYFLNHVC